MVVVVGGGRWGRVLLKTLINNFTELAPIYWVTKFGYKCNLSWVKENNFAEMIILVKKFNLIAQDSKSVGFIVNQANRHFVTAIKYLNLGFNVYIEKPATFNWYQTKQLAKMASIKNRKIAVSLPYFQAKYLTFFREKIPLSIKTVKTINIIWKDSIEERYGLIKKYDISLPLLLDVFPHIWSILRLSFPGDAIRLSNIKLVNGGESLILFGWVGKKELCVAIMRNACQRERILTFVDDKNKKFCINFSIEPGKIYYNDAPYHHQFKYKYNHIFLQLEKFFGSVSNNMSFDDSFKEWETCISLIGPFVNQVINLQKKVIIAAFLSDHKFTRSHYYAMTENLACMLYDIRLIDSFYEQSAAISIIKKILNYVLNICNLQNSNIKLHRILRIALNKNSFFQVLLKDLQKAIINRNYTKGDFVYDKKYN
jgi:hypothetical protein